MPEKIRRLVTIYTLAGKKNEVPHEKTGCEWQVDSKILQNNFKLEIQKNSVTFVTNFDEQFMF